ncbi:MAG TPA: aspartate carbamoyltransferase regulatory subunit [Candidatus Saccharimonadales bacterium]|nr:aspartate carbamoyltransferase regulatory subunit [Candidatus Saccharimonadales bacterium]
MEPTQELYVRKIKDGSVIDHITPGYALEVLMILGIDGKDGEVVSAAINVQSKRHRNKDIVKIQNRELKPAEVDKIALIAPNATINIIRNYAVISKKAVELPPTIRGMMKCDNPSCISNSREPVETQFAVEQRHPARLRCYFCGHIMEREDILKQF